VFLWGSGGDLVSTPGKHDMYFLKRRHTARPPCAVIRNGVTVL